MKDGTIYYSKVKDEIALAVELTHLDEFHNVESRVELLIGLTISCDVFLRCMHLDARTIEMLGLVELGKL